MRNILIVLADDNLGGAEQYLKMVAEYYFNEGYIIDIYFLKKKISDSWTYLESDRFILHFTDYEREIFGVLSTFHKLFINRNKQYKYIFTSFVHINSFISLLRKLRIVKAGHHIARESSSTFNRYTGLKLFTLKFYYKIGYSSIDLLICQTDLMLKQLITGLPNLFSKLNVKVIPNPFNLTSEVNDFPNDIKVFNNFIVSAGRLIPEKGFDILIKSFSLIKNDFENLKLIILGDGEQRTELENLIAELNLEGSVILYGFVQNVYPYFKNADMCVVSSRIEGFPNVLLQMMSQNNNVVSTKCAGGIEEIEGIAIAEVDNTISLHMAMNNCLNKDSLVNRELFDQELEQRSIESFIYKVEKYLTHE